MGHQKKKSRARKQFLLLILFLTAVIAGAVYANHIYEESSLLSIHFVSADGKKTPEYKLSVAATEVERGKGLMYVKEMPRDRGMLFVFPTKEQRSFWMKNTYIPLDMIFLGENLEVVGLLENVPVLNSESRKVDKPSKFVVELNGGSLKPFAVGPGWKAVFNKAVPVAQ